MQLSSSTASDGNELWKCTQIMPQLEEDISVSRLFWSDWWKQILVMSDTRNVHSALSLSERTPLLFSLLPFPFLSFPSSPSPLLYSTHSPLPPHPPHPPPLHGAWAHTVLSVTSVSCQGMNVHASSGESEWGAILGLLILHTPLVKLNMKMKVRGERECVCAWACA